MKLKICRCNCFYFETFLIKKNSKFLGGKVYNRPIKMTGVWVPTKPQPLKHFYYFKFKTAELF